MSFVDTYVVFLLVVVYAASSLDSTYHAFFINICLGKPTLRTLNTLALLCSHRHEFFYLLMHIPCFWW